MSLFQWKDFVNSLNTQIREQKYSVYFSSVCMSVVCTKQVRCWCWLQSLKVSKAVMQAKQDAFGFSIEFFV